MSIFDQRNGCKLALVELKAKGFSFGVELDEKFTRLLQEKERGPSVHELTGGIDYFASIALGGASKNLGSYVSTSTHQQGR